MKKGLIFGYFDVLMPGHLSFLDKARAICEHLTVALVCQPTNSLENSFERRKSQLLSTKLVDNIVPVSQFCECSDVIKNENIDIYAYGDPKWRIKTLDCVVRHIESSRILLNRLHMVIGHACTLKCKHCSAHSPFAPKDARYYDIRKSIDYLQLVVAVSDIKELVILGGEPFLHPDLPLLLTFAINSPDITSIRITTNGTIIPNAILNLLVNQKIVIEISVYSIIREKQEKIISYLDKNGIKKFLTDKDGWIKFDQPRQTAKQTKLIFQSCNYKVGCMILENGVMGYCGGCVIAPIVKNFLPKKGDYLYVSESTDLKTDLYNYVYYPTYMEACRYCNPTESAPRVEPAGEQL